MDVKQGEGGLLFYLLNLENYEMDWLPDFSKITKPVKMQWIIDLHCQKPEIYSKTTEYMDIVLHATKSLIDDYRKLHPTKKHIWFPPAIDEQYFKLYQRQITKNIVFVGNILNRGDIIQKLNKEIGMEYYIMKTGMEMINLIGSSKIHFNKTRWQHVLNNRAFETIGLGTVLWMDTNLN